MTRVSLCLPTFSRAPLLRLTLPCLLDAVRKYPVQDRFEVCISDNASPDDTPNVIRDCAARFTDVRLRHVRQSTNLGFAGNCVAVTQLATGNAFVILADDDKLEVEALDLLSAADDLILSTMPLVLFNSLPGGDAVFRHSPPLASTTTFNGPQQLLRQLGIFHATFVSNLMFHRETALAQMTPDMLQSRYPQTALALTMLRTAPATFMPGKLVRVSLPPDTGDQPLLTSVDMARVMSDYALVDPRCRRLAWRVYSFLLKMLPTAIYQQRLGKCVGDVTNPFTDLRLKNVLRCYRWSWLAQFVALTLWVTARSMPVVLLGALLRKLSRHPR